MKEPRTVESQILTTTRMETLQIKMLTLRVRKTMKEQLAPRMVLPTERRALTRKLLTAPRTLLTRKPMKTPPIPPTLKLLMILPTEQVTAREKTSRILMLTTTMLPRLLTEKELIPPTETTMQLSRVATAMTSLPRRWMRTETCSACSAAW